MAAFTWAPSIMFSTALGFRNSVRAGQLAAVLWGSAVFAQDPNADRIKSLERQIAEQKRAEKDWGGLLRYGSDNTELPAPAPGENRVVFFGDQITEFWNRGKAQFIAGKPWLN